MEQVQLEDFVRELSRYQLRMRGLIRCLLLNPADVEDVWQDTNVVLLKKAGEYREGTDFWAWASQIARYQVMTYCKKVGRDRLVFDPQILELLEQEVAVQAEAIDRRRELLAVCLEKLPSPQRHLLEMRYAASATIENIALQLNRPAGSIKQTLYRIRESLLACVERRLSSEGAS